ncbi:integrase core domain-containing protein [Streptomyces mutabilis]|uniref:WD40 repeat domain-containing protein n=1 Tax=Streptomyces mutabilis TaxID=67332 RepID=UPI003F69C65C
MLPERLKSRWSAEEAGRWHDRLLDDARARLSPGDGWWDLPADAAYWWRHLVWHLRHCDPEATAGLVTHSRWQAARIQRFEVRGLLTDLALADSTEFRTTASTIGEVIGGQATGDREAGELARELLRAPVLMTQMALSADGETLTMANPSGEVSLWDPRSGRRRVELPRQLHEIHRLTLGGNGTSIVIGDLHGIRMLELPGGRERFRLEPDSNPSGTRCAVHAHWLAVPDRRRTRDGALLSTLDVHENSVLDRRLTPDGKLALMESQIGLCKTELIKPRRLWHGLADVELGTAEWVDWFNNQRLHSAIGDIPPHGYETTHYAQLPPRPAAGVNA